MASSFEALATTKWQNTIKSFVQGICTAWGTEIIFSPSLTPHYWEATLEDFRCHHWRVKHRVIYTLRHTASSWRRQRFCSCSSLEICFYYFLRLFRCLTTSVLSHSKKTGEHFFFFLSGDFSRAKNNTPFIKQLCTVRNFLLAISQGMLWLADLKESYPESH